MESWEKCLLPLLPGELAGELRERGMEGAEELRIRVGRPAHVLGAKPYILRWTPDPAGCQQVLLGLCRQSIYAYTSEMAQCFMTLPGGFRVGLAGRVAGNGEEQRLVAPMGFNIRLAREIPGCADRLMPYLLEEGILRSALLISPPGAGKTTLLRDAARQLSQAGIKVCIADERREIAGCDGTAPTLDIGPCTDVVEGCPKALGLRMLLRGMSPQIMVTDEIAGAEDAAAVLDAASCGVPMPVSYTHLDVYKRQPLCLGDWQAPEAAIVWATRSFPHYSV